MLAASLEMSLVGFIVGAFFLSQAYAGLPYLLIALALVAARLGGQLQEAPASAPSIRVARPFGASPHARGPVVRHR